MSGQMKYLSLFRIRFINSLQYRVAAFAGLFTNLAWGGMLTLAFSAFYRSAPEAFPMTFSQTVTYIWLQQMIFTMVSVFLNDSEIQDAIMDGGIVYEMARPVDLYNRWFLQLTAKRISSLFLRGIPTIIVAVFLPYPFGPSLPPSMFYFFSFLISVTLTLAVVISMTLFIYIMTFFTISFRGVQIVSIGIIFFMSGGIVPLPFFPDQFRMIAELLPFASMQNTPLRIFSGHITAADVPRAIGLQVFWIIVLIAGGRALMAHALKRVIVQGG